MRRTGTETRRKSVTARPIPRFPSFLDSMSPSSTTFSSTDPSLQYMPLAKSSNALDRQSFACTLPIPPPSPSVPCSKLYPTLRSSPIYQSVATVMISASAALSSASLSSPPSPSNHSHRSIHLLSTMLSVDYLSLISNIATSAIQHVKS